jgi:hypothetical protein
MTMTSSSPKADGLKLHCLTAFHGSVVAYYAIVDFHMLLASIKMLQIGHPITQMFLGGSLQFYTTWNQVSVDQSWLEIFENFIEGFKYYYEGYKGADLKKNWCSYVCNLPLLLIMQAAYICW